MSERLIQAMKLVVEEQEEIRKLWKHKEKSLKLKVSLLLI